MANEICINNKEQAANLQASSIFWKLVFYKLSRTQKPKQTKKPPNISSENKEEYNVTFTVT